MKVSISNIAWKEIDDNKVYSLMSKYGFNGLEIAPTRWFSEKPYEQLMQAKQHCKKIKDKYGYDVCSMQSIWYGRTENLFRSKEEYESLVLYTKKAIEFAESIACRNIVFGCPKNRNNEKNSNFEVGYTFFKEIADYAQIHNVVIGLEPNPSIYNTNFVNTTEDAFSIVKTINSKGLAVNLDIGTMIENNEVVNVIENNIQYISHVHISEPYLKLIQKRKIHNDIIQVLKNEGYQKYISIEMSTLENVNEIENVMKYISELVRK